LNQRRTIKLIARRYNDKTIFDNDAVSSNRNNDAKVEDKPKGSYMFKMTPKGLAQK